LVETGVFVPFFDDEDGDSLLDDLLDDFILKQSQRGFWNCIRYVLTSQT
jgi:hypothetical protein